MAYIGNQPTSVAFLTDYFTGNGSTTSFTMSVAPATSSSILVTVTGVVQDPTTYSVNGTTLTFSPAPPTGSIAVRYLGIPASGVVTTAYRTVTEFTATAGQTTFTPPSYSVGFINVFRNGVRLGAANFTATNGTSVVLGNAASVGDLIVIESFQVSSFNNALPQTGGTINAPANSTPLIVQSNGVTGLFQDSAGNVGVGAPTQSGYGELQVRNGFAYINEDGTDSKQMYLRTNYNNVGPAIQVATNDPLMFITANAERMRIDSAGRITTPSQPNATLSLTSAVSSTNFGTGGAGFVNATFSYDLPVQVGTYATRGGITISSDGTRNSRINLPVGGRYLVCSNLHIDITQNIRAFGWRVKLNGNVVYGHGWASFTFTGSGTTHAHCSYSDVINAAAGDYISFDMTAYDSPAYYTLNGSSTINVFLLG